MPEFTDLVLNFWLSEEVAASTDNFELKIKKLTRIIAQWKKGRIKNLDLQLKVIREYIEWADKTMEVRNLSELEILVRTMLKRRLTVLAEWEETRWQQRSTLNWKLMGDRNTKYFHSAATCHKRRNTIDSLATGESMTSNQREINRAFHSFCSLMGSAPNDTGVLEDIKWSMLYPEERDAHTILSTPISEDEIRHAIMNWPNNKSPGPDGFTGEFFKHFIEEFIPNVCQTLNAAKVSGTLYPLEHLIHSTGTEDGGPHDAGRLQTN